MSPQAAVLTRPVGWRSPAASPISAPNLKASVDLMRPAASRSQTQDAAELLDRAILHRLATDPLLATSDLASDLSISASLATARLRALQSRNAVSIRPVINVDKAGRIFVFCKMAINAESLYAALHTIAAQRSIVSVSAIFGGRFNALIYFTYGDMGELHRMINEVLMNIDGFAEMETFIISGALFFKPEYINYPGVTFTPDFAGNTETLRLEAARCGLDELNTAIVSELQCHGKKSIRALAREYGISPGTIHYRLQLMEKQGIIRFVSVIGHAALALNCFVLVEMQVEPRATAAIVGRVSGKPWLGHLLEVVGGCNLLAFVNAADMAEAQSIISDEVRTLPGLKSISVSMLMNTVKLDPRWGFSTLRQPGKSETQP